VGHLSILVRNALTQLKLAIDSRQQDQEVW
jgi:hypothetical protein